MADKFTFSSAGEIQMIEFALARNEYTHELVSALAPVIDLAISARCFSETRKSFQCRILKPFRSAIATRPAPDVHHRGL